MKAVRLHAARDLRVEDVPPPAPPGPGEITLRVTTAGICGSDLHNFRTGAWISRVSVAGHEFSGVVTACGAGVDHVAEGDRVLVDSRHICGTCAACRDGLGQVCAELGFLGEKIDGGFAEAVTLPARNVLRAPDGVPDDILALAEPLAVALHALNKLAAPPGVPILITGCGPIGGLVALLAARRGHEVSATDLNDDRAALVAGIARAEVMQLDDLSGRTIRHAVDTTGAPAVISALVDRLSPGGGIALVGIGHGEMILDPVKLVEKEVALIGVHAFGDELTEVARLLPGLADDLGAVVAERITLDQVPAAYDRHLSGKVTGLKTLIRCGAPS